MLSHNIYAISCAVAIANEKNLLYIEQWSNRREDIRSAYKEKKNRSKIFNFLLVSI